MKSKSGQVRVSIVLGLVLATGATALVIAQQSSSSNSTTTSKDGRATASASASGRSSSGSQNGISQIANGGSLGFNSGIDPNKILFAVWYTMVPDSRSGQIDPNADKDHSQYMKFLMHDRTLVMEGPFGDNSGYLTIMQADNEQRALQLVNDDPAVKNNGLRYVMKRWVLRSGGPSEGSIGLPSPASTGQTSGRSGGQRNGGG